MVTPADWTLLIPGSVHRVITTLDASGYQTWLVGGCVRDLALGRVPLDFDLSTSARPEEVLAIFPHAFATGLAHGTVTVLIEHHPIEVTTFRSEGHYSDNRRPDSVAFETDINLDLSRRDFTINSMAFHPERGLLDPFGGWNDLMAGRMRTVGDARTRFREDALRMMRAVRFTLTYNLVPDSDLIEAIRVERSRATSLSVERITHELGRMMRSPHGETLCAFESSEILPVIARRLFRIEPDNRRLTELLAAWIRPAWHADQTMPLFYLACRLCDQAAEAGHDPYMAGQAADRSDPREQSLRRILAPRSIEGLSHQLQVDCRMSRLAARHGYAALYAAGLRLHLDTRTACSAEDLAVLLRVLARTMALDPATARRCAADGWAVLNLFLPSHTCFQHELTNLRQQIQLDLDRNRVYELPIALSELALTGSDLVYQTSLRGPRLGLLLERLLSFVQVEPALNATDQLARKAVEWGFIP
jgi:hypothetical protein